MVIRTEYADGILLGLEHNRADTVWAYVPNQLNRDTGLRLEITSELMARWDLNNVQIVRRCSS